MKDSAVRSKRYDTFLDARTCSVVETNKWCTDLQCKIHQLVNFFGKDFAKGTTKNGEILREHKYLAIINGSPAGDDSVGIWSFFESSSVRTMPSEHVKFMKRTGIKKILKSLASQEFAFFVLAFYGSGTTRIDGLFLT